MALMKDMQRWRGEKHMMRDKTVRGRSQIRKGLVMLREGVWILSGRQRGAIVQ